MNKEDRHIKPIMQVLFGIGLFVVYYLMNEPIKTVEKFEGTNFYHPSDELFLQFIKWTSLICSIGLILLGITGTIKNLKPNKK